MAANETARAFFGRRKGKSLRPVQAEALQSGLKQLRLDLTGQAPSDPRDLFEHPVATVRLEIGFGGGEHLLHEAGRFPGTGFIGVEPFVNGMAKLMAALDRAPLGNLRVFDDDATFLLDWLPDSSLAGIDLLYPDPWPKKRHWKRRFVNPANVDRFARVLRPGARFRFASDIESYVDWTLLLMGRSADFDFEAKTADDWRRPYEGWPGTRYEAKAIREGRTPAYLTFSRK